VGAERRDADDVPGRALAVTSLRRSSISGSGKPKPDASSNSTFSMSSTGRPAKKCMEQVKSAR
jgi:hypothetical protein